MTLQDRPMNQRWELIDLSGTKTYPLEFDTEFIAGRSSESNLFLDDLSCSRRQFRIFRESSELWLEGLSGSVPTCCDGEMIHAPRPVRDGMLVTAGQKSFRIRKQRVTSSAGQSVGQDDTFSTQMGSIAALDENGLPEGPFVLTGDVIIGRDTTADLCLPHVRVSRLHARIRRGAATAIVEDLGSANGTFINGRRLVLPESLVEGACIEIGPYSLIYTGTALVSSSRSNNLQIEARNLKRVVGSGRKQTEVILDDVSLVIRPHEFVCFLGPTGSGKSTLLKALSGQVPANSGQVLINQSELYESFESLKRDIGFVPQHDVLHGELSLFDALSYTARLRLPSDTSREEIARRIQDLLACVGLDSGRHRSTILSRLSGGQQRRASLANELISNPSLLFLDEVTSGLDEATDLGMMKLFRRLADEGRTVICVTHTLANIAETCHLIVLLTVGGKLAFVGSPTEALDYFAVPRLGLIYGRLSDAGEAERLAAEFRKTELYRRYVTARLSSGVEKVKPENTIQESRYWQHQWRLMKHQFPLLLRRYAQVFLSEKRTLKGLLMQVLVVAAVLYMVFGDISTLKAEEFRVASQSCSVMFVLAVSCFWFGCNNSAREIVRERDIFTLELRASLDPGSYYASKFFLQSAMAAFQSLMLLGFVSYLCAVPGHEWQQGVMLVLASTAGVAVGLFLSSVSVKESIALTLVPLVLIPQIILSDVFVELTGFSKILAQLFVSNYWIYGALRGTLEDYLLHQLNPPLAPPASFVTAVFAIVIQIVTLISASVAVLHVRDRIMACSNRTFAEVVEGIPGIGPPLSSLLKRRIKAEKR